MVHNKFLCKHIAKTFIQSYASRYAEFRVLTFSFHHVNDVACIEQMHEHFVPVCQQNMELLHQNANWDSTAKAEQTCALASVCYSDNLLSCRNTDIVATAKEVLATEKYKVHMAERYEQDLP